MQKKPTASIEAIRSWYRNRPPALSVDGLSEVDAAHVQRLRLPQFADITMVSVSEPYESDRIGSLALRKNPDNSTYCFAKIVPSQDNENIIDIQERVLADLGIQFS